MLEKNLQDWNYPLSKVEKIWVGSYLILRDYSEGQFPPRFANEQTTFAAEKAYYDKLQTLGKSADELRTGAMRKPFWHGGICAKYMRDYGRIQSALFSTGLQPPARLLEVGCGSGWVAEFLAATGFDVLATDLDPNSAEYLERRGNSLAAKDLPHNLHFRATAMEYVRDQTADLEPFDAVYVYEALHHAYDWRKALKSFYDGLRPGGWCFIFSEPNALHTFVSYRLGKLSNTHEIGIPTHSLKKQLRAIGFTKIKVLHNHVHFWIKPNWIVAQKPAGVY